MRTKCALHLPVLLLLGIFLWNSSLFAQSKTSAANGVPVHMLIVAETKKGMEVPVLHPDDVMVYQGKDRDKVTELTSLKGAPQQLFLLIDDALDSSSVGHQLQDVRGFIGLLPATTAVGVAYMRNSSAQVLQDPTTDHAAAAKAVRLTLG